MKRALQSGPALTQQPDRDADVTTQAHEPIPDVCFIPDVCRALKISPRTVARLLRFGAFPIEEMPALDNKHRWSGLRVRQFQHPPCTHLSVSGARWFAGKRREQAEALDFVRALLNAPIPRIALENPVSIISSAIRKPDQTIQPWQFGHGEVKRTCLWLKGLAKLTPTHVVSGREARIWKMGPSPERWRERSRTFTGIAEAMAAQWGIA